MKAGDIIRLMYNNATYRVEEVGHFLLQREKRESLAAGDVGYIIAGVKTVSDVRTGDTITLENRPCAEAPAGLQGGQAGRLRLDLPHRLGRLRGPGRLSGEIQAQRRLLRL